MGGQTIAGSVGRRVAFARRRLSESDLFKSEEQLAQFMVNLEHLSYAYASVEAICELACQTGWFKGCEMLIEYDGIPVMKEMEKSIFTITIRSESLEVMQFRLRTRAKTEDHASLKKIGNLEDAFDLVSWNNSMCADAVFSALVHDRTQLQSLADEHLLPGCLQCLHGGLPDSQRKPYTRHFKRVKSTSNLTSNQEEHLFTTSFEKG